MGHDQVFEAGRQAGRDIRSHPVDWHGIRETLKGKNPPAAAEELFKDLTLHSYFFHRVARDIGQNGRYDTQRLIGDPNKGFSEHLQRSGNYVVGVCMAGLRAGLGAGLFDSPHHDRSKPHVFNSLNGKISDEIDTVPRDSFMAFMVAGNTGYGLFYSKNARKDFRDFLRTDGSEWIRGYNDYSRHP
jgi:hypothetical protein